MKKNNKLRKLLETLHVKLSDYLATPEEKATKKRTDELNKFIDSKLKYTENKEFLAPKDIILKTMLKNTVQHLLSNNDHSPNFSKNILEIVFKTYEHLDKGILKLVGCQPMVAPVGLVYNLEYKEIENEDTARRLSLQVVSRAAEAHSRKFLQLSKEAKKYLDEEATEFTDEVMNAIASESAITMTKWILESLTENIKPSFLGKFNTYFKSPNKFVSKIFLASNSIAHDTRRGAGNVVIVDPLSLSLLQISNHFIPVEKSSDKKGWPNGIIKVGTLGEREYGVSIDVYLNIYSSNEIVIGYKGKNGETDTGFVFSPYISHYFSSYANPELDMLTECDILTRYGIVNISTGYYRVLKFKED